MALRFEQLSCELVIRLLIVYESEDGRREGYEETIQASDVTKKHEAVVDSTRDSCRIFIHLEIELHPCTIGTSLR